MRGQCICVSYSLHEPNRIRKRSMHRFVQDIAVRLFDEQIKHEDRRLDDETKEDDEKSRAIDNLTFSLSDHFFKRTPDESSTRHEILVTERERRKMKWRNTDRDRSMRFWYSFHRASANSKEEKVPLVICQTILLLSAPYLMWFFKCPKEATRERKTRTSVVVVDFSLCCFACRPTCYASKMVLALQIRLSALAIGLIFDTHTHLLFN